ALSADLRVDEEAVEQAEALGERVVVRRDLAREEQERGVAIALGQIAEDLIVGAVLLDDVDDVLEGRIDTRRPGAVPTVRARNPLRESRQIAERRLRNHRESAVQLAEGVAVGVLPELGQWLLHSGIR